MSVGDEAQTLTTPPSPACPWNTGLLTVMFAVTGTGFSAVRRLQNDGKVSHTACFIPGLVFRRNAFASKSSSRSRLCAAHTTHPRPLGGADDGAGPAIDRLAARAVGAYLVELKSCARLADLAHPFNASVRLAFRLARLLLIPMTLIHWHLRFIFGQTEPIAPKGFSNNSAWQTEKAEIAWSAFQSHK